MSRAPSRASSLAHAIAEHTDDEIIEALQLILTQRPDLIDQISTPLLQGESTRYTGIISAFYPQKRYGFISSAEVSADFGMDTFISDQELGPFGEGNLVTFSVVLNKDGKPQARLLEAAESTDIPVVGHSTGGTQLAGIKRPAASQAIGVALRRPKVELAWTPASAPVWAPASAATAPAARPPLWIPASAPVVVPPTVPGVKFDLSTVARPPAAVLPDGVTSAVSPSAPSAVQVGTESDERYVGVISCFYPEKLYGFILCPEVKELYGYDTFLSSKEIASFNAGDVVAFSVALNSRGKPQARSLLATSDIDVADLGSFIDEVDVGDNWDLQDSENLQSAEDVKAPIEEQHGQRFVGSIKAFNPDKHFGFIGCEEVTTQYGYETFLSDKEIKNFANGDWVSFSIALNGKGQPQARELQPFEQ